MRPPRWARCAWWCATRLTRDPQANWHPKHDEQGWRFYAFVTHREGDKLTFDAEHRDHGVASWPSATCRRAAGSASALGTA